MKYSLILLTFILSYLPVADSKFDLFCHKWRMVGMKMFHKGYMPAKSKEEEVMTIRKDGTYEKILYGQLKTEGQWKFTDDSTKLLFSISSMNGAPMQDMPLDKQKPTDSLLKLTTDTLIIAQLKYYGPNQEYGHDDAYYTREDKK